MYFVMLSNAFRQRVHVNTRAKGNPMKAVREGSIIFRFDWKTYKPKEYQN